MCGSVPDLIKFTLICVLNSFNFMQLCEIWGLLQKCHGIFSAALLTLSQAVKSPECVRRNMANNNCDEDENGHSRVGDAAGFVCGASTI
jgi:hypothetical protein